MVGDRAVRCLGPASKLSRLPLLHLAKHERRMDGPRAGNGGSGSTKGDQMVVALIVLLLLLAVFGGLGFAANVLWYVLIAALILWLIGFFVGGAADATAGGRRGWYRW